MRPELTAAADRRREIAERILRRVAELNGEVESHQSPSVVESAPPTPGHQPLEDSSDAPELDADVLVEEALAGRPEAWDMLVERLLPLVLATVHRYPLSDSDSDDVVQTVLLRLVQHMGDLGDTRTVAEWLTTTTCREANRAVYESELARRRRVELSPSEVPGLEEDVPGPATPGSELGDERAQALRHAIEELDPAHRSLLLLLLVDPPIPIQAIGEALGVPVDRIGKMRADALSQLRKSEAFRRFMVAT